MPNWCTTDIKIFPNEKSIQKLAKLYELIREWTFDSEQPNDFGTTWLGNVVLRSSIGSIDLEDKYFVNCRGSIDYIELNNNMLSISTTTAWTPCLKMWQKICDKYLDKDYELVYVAEEPGCDIFATNDSSYVGKYILQSYCDNIESQDCLSEADLVQFLRRFLKTNNEKLDRLLDINSKSQPNEDFFALRKWEFVDVEYWD